MKKFLLLITVLVLILIGVGAFLSGKKSPSNSTMPTPTPTQSLSSRATLIGIAGYTPAYFPNSGIEDIRAYWQEVNGNAEIYGIHVDWKQVSTMQSLLKQTRVPVELTVGFQNPSDWNNVEGVIHTIEVVLKENKNIKYLGIGNEVNLLAIEHPNDFPRFVSAFKAISQRIKASYPDIKIFTTYQYDCLVQKATLMGTKCNNSPSWELLRQFEDAVDFFSFTVYPFFEYKEVDAIPSTYFVDVSARTQKPYAISETSWPTQGSIALLKGKGYVYSEDEQVQYLQYLENLAKSQTKLEFIAVVFLNDYRDWQKEGNSTSPLFDSVGLKYNDGTEKKGYAVWKEWVKK